MPSYFFKSCCYTGESVLQKPWFLPVTFGEIRPPVGKEVEAGKQITDKKQREVNRKRAHPFIIPTVFLAPKP